jgi:predicted transposase YbfD/YdcC
MVSAYSQRQDVVVAVQAFESKSTSELKVVQKLLKALALQDVVVTLDALHCQKNYTVDC